MSGCCATLLRLKHSGYKKRDGEFECWTLNFIQAITL